MLCVDWWYWKLWKMCCEWWEEQLCVVCLVSKKVFFYVSYEVVMYKCEQCCKLLEFFCFYELVNEDGDMLDMEDVVNVSSSNFVYCCNEMMVCVKGLEFIVEMCGDCVVFYIIICLLCFYFMLNNGRFNLIWINVMVR